MVPCTKDSALEKVGTRYSRGNKVELRHLAPHVGRASFVRATQPAPSLFACKVSLFCSRASYLKVGTWLSYPNASHKDENSVPTGHLSWERQKLSKKHWEGEFYAMVAESGYLMSLISLKKWKRCGGEQGVALRL